MLNEIEQRIKNKIEKIGVPLKDWDINIYRGVLTGFNEAFIIDEKTKNELVEKSDSTDLSEIIRPILRGRDINRYSKSWADLWLIFIPWHFPLHSDFSISGVSNQAEIEFKNQYPHIYNYLLKHKEKLEARNKSETGIRYEWYALQRCANTYLNDFNEEKIIYSEIVREPQFCLDANKMFVNDTSFIMTGNNLRYVLALLNSKPVSFFFKTFYAGGGLGEEGYRYKKVFLEKLPLPNMINIKRIEDIVNEIITLKIDAKSTLELENTIDEIVYKLYELTDNEIKYINQF